MIKNTSVYKKMLILIVFILYSLAEGTINFHGVIGQIIDKFDKLPS